MQHCDQQPHLCVFYNAANCRRALTYPIRQIVAVRSSLIQTLSDVIEFPINYVNTLYSLSSFCVAKQIFS